MAKYPFPENEPARLNALENYNLMDSGEDKEFDAIAAIASAICGIPISLITFIDENSSGLNRTLVLILQKI